ncbi:hypothetical protein [Thermodesulforhabdus norvegica]|uniref:RCK N-terminal domain-containing protein n=1 Tax=Thermodesulforhabdus norvegica TaxID=39841 RepID=A0A1I4QKB2_9BACT|nr:hypothetical protein [Thermodesulforhabdus norvegica]SFM40487.1 hypothetical protein SAMN05660836_00082 [Thermodesulforhabdus norvegica]
MDTILRLWEQENIDSLEGASGVVLIGAGQFGRKALKRLFKKHPSLSFTVVDARKEAIDLARREKVNFTGFAGDGIDYLVENPPDEGAWIIPAVPIHLAYLWLSRVLALSGFRIGPCPVPEELSRRLPNPFHHDADCIFASNATFLCPDHCSEPDGICTYTKEPRKPDLFSLIADSIPTGWAGAVVRSFQLAPGIGGYPAKHLRLLEEWAKKLPAGRALIIATACRCHGVVHAGRILQVK